MIYLASPYSHKDPEVRQKRYEIVCEACAIFAQQNIVVYSPIAMWHPIANEYGLPKDFNFWEFNDQEMIELCDIFVVLTIGGWITSDGIKRERFIAGTHGKRIIYASLDMCKYCNRLFYDGT